MNGEQNGGGCNLKAPYWHSLDRLRKNRKTSVEIASNLAETGTGIFQIQVQSVPVTPACTAGSC